MNVLVITDGFINQESTIGSVLENVLAYSPANSAITIINLSDYGLMTRRYNSVISESFTIEKPLENFSGFSRMAEFAWKLGHFDLNRVVDRIRTLISNKTWDYVLISLHSQASIIIANQLRFPENTALVFFIWDDFEWWGKSNKLPQSKIEEVLETRNQVIKRAHKVFVPSSEMRLILSAQVDRVESNVFEVLMPYFLEDPKENKDAQREGKLKYVIIGFAGSLYAINQLKIFTRAIEILSMRIPDIAIDFRVFTKDSSASHLPGTRNFGYLSRNELHSHLEKCDLLFLPFPSEQWFTEYTNNSWPSKFANYAAVSKPVFYLGSKKSSLSRVLQEGDYPLNFDSMSAYSVAHYLEMFVTSKKLRMDASKKILKIYKKCHSKVNWQDNMRKISDDWKAHHQENFVEVPSLLINHANYSAPLINSLVKLYVAFNSTMNPIKRLSRLSKLIARIITVIPDHVKRD